MAPVTKEELGRCTWTFLHTLAAQVLLDRLLCHFNNWAEEYCVCFFFCASAASFFVASKSAKRENFMVLVFPPEFGQFECHVS